jgi:hypothetical protein
VEVAVIMRIEATCIRNKFEDKDVIAWVYAGCGADVAEDTCRVFLEQLSAGISICLNKDVKVFKDPNSLNCSWIVIIQVFKLNVLIKPAG